MEMELYRQSIIDSRIPDGKVADWYGKAWTIRGRVGRVAGHHESTIKVSETFPASPLVSASLSVLICYVLVIVSPSHLDRATE